MNKLSQLSLVVLLWLLLWFPQCLHAGNVTFGGAWKDTDGNLINAHGGGLLLYNGTYYWFGEHRPYSGGSTEVGVTCYSSRDLCRWKYEGVALSVSSEPGSDIERGCIMERPKVLYCAKTGKFVLWFHLELKGKGYEAARYGVAVADRVTGPYRFLYSGRANPGKYPENMSMADRAKKWNVSDYPKWWMPQWMKAVKGGMFTQRDLAGGQMSRDMTLYVDDDGKAYHIFASEENLTLQIAELTPDFLHHTGRYVRVAPGGQNEAPTLFKHDGTYWMMTSGCTGWAPNKARMFSAASIWGPWEQHPSPFVGKDAETTFGGQGTYVQQLPDQTFMFMADIWNPNSLARSEYFWLPIEFNFNDRPMIKRVGTWSLTPHLK